MKWYSKKIIISVIVFVVSVPSVILINTLFLFSVNIGWTFYAILFAFFSISMSIITYLSFQHLILALKTRKKITQANLTSVLHYINPYNSHKDLLNAFLLQNQNSLYHDKKITITKDFVAEHRRGKVYIINGILDAAVYLRKTHGKIKYISLILFYYDGNRFEIKYRRPLGRTTMQEKAADINLAVNIIANQSENFRKYPSHRLTYQ